jgi:hypothetical protein
MLAMLRVAPLLRSPTLRAAAIVPQVGTGKQVHRSNWKPELRCLAMPVMHFYSSPTMHLLSGVDTSAAGGPPQTGVCNPQPGELLFAGRSLLVPR